MSFHSHNSQRNWSRRSCLKWAAVAAAALSPIASRAGCPCSEDEVKAEPPPPAPPGSPAKVLRVCADPNNLPFSNRKKEGFEDRIAELVAKDLGLPLEY